MRAFIAIALPVEIKEKITAIQTKLKSCDCQAKWVRPENVHLTLKFLGNIREEQVDAVKTAIDGTAQQYKAFKASLEGFGFFPDERRPRVFFISTSQEKTLRSLADYLEEKLAEIGFAKEGRFTSHLTLARFKGQKNIGCLKEKLNTIALEGCLPVNEIILFKSTLTGAGPIYEIMARSPLTA